MKVARQALQFGGWNLNVARENVKTPADPCQLSAQLTLLPAHWNVKHLAQDTNDADG